MANENETKIRAAAGLCGTKSPVESPVDVQDLSIVRATVILPERSDDEISRGLRWLTQQLQRIRVAEHDAFGLGGEYGYGVNYENDVFSIHRYCWCGGYDCPWCSYSNEEGMHFQERFRGSGALPEHGGAPNFWHKPTGFRVWWYKWIGRDNEVEYVPSDLRAVFTECRDSAR